MFEIHFYFQCFRNKHLLLFIGEVVSLPLSRTITSIWPLPFGLLLQQEVEANIPSHVPFSSASPLLNTRDMSRPRRELGNSPQHCVSPFNELNHIQKGEVTSMSSHLILMDPLDEQQVCYNSFPLLLRFYLFIFNYALYVFTGMDSCFDILFNSAV